jgi:hypothetical protein
LSELIESAVDNAIQKTLPSAIQKTTRRKFKNSKHNLPQFCGCSGFSATELLGTGV